MSQEAIVGGRPSPALFPLTPARLRAFVALSIPPVDASEREGVCSGVVVAPGIVLTAKHCFDGDQDGAWDESPSGAPIDVTIVLGSPDEPSSVRGPVEVAWLHPELDVGLIEASWLDSPVFGIEPLLTGGDELDDSWSGAPVELAGYGITDAVEDTGLFFAVEEVARVEANYLVVDGRGLSGACYGDSGGPVIGRTDDARFRVLGVLDDGDPSCTGQDFFTRTDRLLGWEPFDRLVASERGIQSDCESLSRGGLCTRDRAMWCENGLARVHDCRAEGMICGWSTEVAGFRCVSREEDPCGGSGSSAHCADETVISCHAGSPISIACEDCARRCAPWVTEAGAACVPR